MAGWHTPETVSKGWSEAPSDQTTLAEYVDAAREQCISHLVKQGITPPDVEASPPEDVPADYRLAHRMQTKDLWAASQTGDRVEQTGMDGLQVRRSRMSATVRGLLAYEGIGLG